MKINTLGWLYRADTARHGQSKAHRLDQAHFQPRFEQLEERRLLSVVPAVAPDVATLSITKTDNLGGSSVTNTAGSYIAGEAITYTITVTNIGAVGSADTSIVDTLPTSITGATYTASQTGGASGFTANGSGNIDDTGVDLPVGSSVVYTVKGTIASLTTGTITNTASATPEEDDDVSATDTDNPIDLVIGKSDTGGGLGSSDPALFGATTTGTATAGKALTYTVSVSNLGTGTVTGAKVADLLPANFTASGYTATLEGGATDTNPVGSGNINDTVTLPPDAEISYTVTGTVSSTATGTLSNTASVTPSGGTAISATDTDNIDPAANSSLSGYVYIDGNNNGVRDPGETGIPSVPVTLTGTATGGGSVNLSTTTDSTGFYSFANLDPGTYTITETQPTNYIEGKDAVGSQGSGTIAQTATTNAIQTITLASGVSGTQNDFGNVGLTLNNVSKRAFMYPPMNTIEDPAFSLAISKVDNAGGSSITNTAGNVTAGQSLTYTIVVTNSGTAASTGVTIADPQLTTVLSGDTWTASETGGASGFSASGSGNIDNTGVDLPAGSTITYTVTGTVTATTGSFSNTATVTPSGGTAIPATDTDNLPSLSIFKSDNAGGSSQLDTEGNVNPGQSLTYTVVVSNTGPGSVTGATIADANLTTVLSGDTWTAGETGGASGFSASGSGNIDDTSVDMPAGSIITYSITGNVTATTGTFSNTASVTPPGGTAKTATDTDKLPDLTITKVDNAGGSSITPSTGSISGNQVLTYTIVVGNSGPGNQTNATISDALPSFFTGAAWTATGSGGASGFATSGSGNIDQTGVDLPSGSSITYTVTGNVVVPTNSTVQSISNTATVTGGGTTHNATDTDDLFDLTITKVDNAGGSSITPSTGNVNSGQSLTYTVVVSNSGLGGVTGATIADPDLTSVLAGDTWTAGETGGASGFSASGSGNIDQTGVDMPAGSTITYTITGTVTATSGSFSNTASVTPPGGTAKTATDTDNLPDLTITKVDNAGGSRITPSIGNVNSGQTLTYTVVVSNSGPGSETGATIADADLTTVLSGDTWTAGETGGASGFTPSGSGNIDDTSVDMPAGSTITYTITGTVIATSGSISNTASVTPPGGTAKTATDTDNLPDLTITKVDNAGGSSITPSTGSITNDQTLTYTIVVSNSGPGNQTGAIISDPLPTFFSGATSTAVGAGGASGFAHSGSGNIDQTGVDLPAGSSITYTVTGTVDLPEDTNLPVQSISNTATVTGGGTTHNATDTDDVIDLQISKNDSANGGMVSPGETMSYTVVVTNAGIGTDTVTIDDPLPPDFSVTGWTAANTGTGTATGFATSGTGSIAQTGVTMPAGSAITYTIDGSISSSATGGSTITNTASATPAGGNTVTATVSDLVGIPALSIVKGDNAGGSSSPSATGNVNPGQTLTYTVVVGNTGTGPADGVKVTDPLPSVFDSASYTTVLAGGATDSTPSGTGVTSLSDTVSLPIGGSITYTITGTVNSGAAGTLLNTATATPVVGSPVTATDPDNLTGLEIEKSDSAGGDSGLQTLTSSPAGTTGSAFQNDPLDYTITVTNIGPGTVTGATVSDSFPSGYSLTSWSVTGTTGGATDTTSSGTSDINDSVTLASGASITYTVDGFAQTFGTLSNTATVAPTVGSSISATDIDNVQENTEVVPVGGLSTSAVVAPAVMIAPSSSGSSGPSAAGVDALLAGLGPHNFQPASLPSASSNGLGAGYAYNAPGPGNSNVSDAALEAFLASPQFGEETVEHSRGEHRWS